MLVGSLLDRPLAAQVYFNFEDTAGIAQWIQQPDNHWMADTLKAINGEYSLHHVFDADVAATDYVYTFLEYINLNDTLTSWQFNVRYGYAPSSSNNWSFFLLANDALEKI
ncbi:MAG: hypothetical protein HC896_04975 [Bacteroidales bacterium]|nr:hypothetical protein [Bacteroidales bacterium]